MAKRGRPTKKADPGTRVSLGLKVTADLKDMLESAAAGSGRTQSQEAEARIERTFMEDYWVLKSVAAHLALRYDIFEAMELIVLASDAAGRKAAIKKIKRLREGGGPEDK